MREAPRNPILAGLALLGLAAAGCSPGGGGSDPRARFGQNEDSIPAVEAVEVVQGTLPLEERLAGSVRARNQTEIYPEITGHIVEVLANDGDRVEAGQPLVRLRDTDYREQLRQAEAGLAVAQAQLRQAEAELQRLQANLRRVEAMAERDLVSQAELETAQADAASAEANVDLMRAQLDQAESLVAERGEALADTVVRAPISGIVGGRTAEIGQLASTSTPLFVIGDTSDMLVEVTLTQRMLGYIDPGMSVNVTTDAAPDQVIEAQISRISPFLHPVTRTTQAEIELTRPAGMLRSGMFVTVDVLYGETELAPLIPNSAIYRNPRDGRTGVFAASLDEAPRDVETPEGESPLDSGDPLQPVGPVEVRFVPIELVARGRMTSAVDGIEPGQWVVTLGHHLLDGNGTGQALIQPTPWDHIMRLQQIQTRDMLDVIRERREALTGGNDVESLN